MTGGIRLPSLKKSVIPASQSLRQEDHKFKASGFYLIKLCLKIKISLHLFGRGKIYMN